MFACARARSSMIFDARNSSRRCTTVTFVANFDRKIASSIAESPPPTMIVWRVAEEGGVAGRAVADAAAGELVLAGDAELLVLGAHRQDDGARPVLGVADPHAVHAAGLAGELDAVGLLGDAGARRSARPGRGTSASSPGPSRRRGSRGSSRRRSSAAAARPTRSPRSPAGAGSRARCTARPCSRRGRCR